MLFWKFLFSSSVMVMIGIFGGLIYTKILKRHLFGGTKAGICVGILGSFLGGFLINLFFEHPFLAQIQDTPYLKYLVVNIFDINFIASGLGIFFFLKMYEIVSRHTEIS